MVFARILTGATSNANDIENLHKRIRKLP